MIADNITKIYEGDVIALRNVSFEVVKPTLTCLLGPNGAGKTTLINILAGVIKPTSGTILVLGSDPYKDRRVKYKVGFVPQEAGVMLMRTVEENLLTIAALYDIPGNDARRRAKEIIELLGLSEYRDVLASKLSGGLRRRLSLGMSLMHNPEVLILDEPTTGLDPAARISFLNLLKSMVEEGRTVIMSTHIGEDAELCHEVIVLHQGRIVARGSPETLRRETLGLRTVITLIVDNASKVAKAIGGVPTKVEGYDAVKVIVNDVEKELPNIMSKVLSSGSTINEIRIRRPTMNEVFLALTGHSLEV